MIYTKQQLKQHSELKNKDSHQALQNIGKCLENGEIISLFEAKYFVEYLISRPIGQKDKILFINTLNYILSFDNQLCNEYVLCMITIPNSFKKKDWTKYFNFTKDEENKLNSYPNINLLKLKWEKIMTGEIPCLDTKQNIVQQEAKIALDNMKKASIFFNSDGSLNQNLYNQNIDEQLSLYYYFYLTIKLVFDEESASNFIITFNGYDIVYDATSLIHILIRHYGGELNAYNSVLGSGHQTKSIHKNKKFAPITLFNELKYIYNLVEISGLITGKPQILQFKYENKIYQILTNISSNGKYHIDTFHEVDIEAKIEKIKLRAETILNQ
jgi:hypothetical protein